MDVNGESDGAFRTIGEVAESLDLPPHVLRFWETRFSQIAPVKRAGGRRYYRPRDVELVAAIRHLLYGRGYTIKGVQRLLREQGVRAVVENARAGDPESRGFDFGEPRGEEAEPAFLASDVPGEAPPSLHTPPTEDVPAVGRPPGTSLAPLVPRAPATLTLPAVRLVETPTGGSAPEQARRLREALEDLSECRRMLRLTIR